MFVLSIFLNDELCMLTGFIGGCWYCESTRATEIPKMSSLFKGKTAYRLVAPEIPDPSTHISAHIGVQGKAGDGKHFDELKALQKRVSNIKLKYGSNASVQPKTLSKAIGSLTEFVNAKNYAVDPMAILPKWGLLKSGTRPDGKPELRDVMVDAAFIFLDGALGRR
jgi:hypothetical protein